MLRVNGGPAHSGTVVKRERGGVWVHECTTNASPTWLVENHSGLRELPGYWVSCPDCGTKRP